MKGRGGCVRSFGHEHDFCQAENESPLVYPYPKKHPKLRPWSEFSLPRNSDHGLEVLLSPIKTESGVGLSFGPSFSRTMV